MLLGRNVDGVAHMTTRDVLRTERELVERTMDGRGIVSPLVPKDAASADLATAAETRGIALSDEQTRAALAVLSGQNRYQLVQGDAGSGKTTLFAMLKDVAANHGHDIVALTPQHRLANELRADTGLAVETVAGFLARHQRATGNGAPDAVARATRDIGGRIVLIDEASMLSSRQMLGIMQIADNADAARLILVGDSQQISSPEAGRPFALLQEQGAPATHLSENRRQRDPGMLEAVAAARLGNVQRALDALGGKVSESASPAQAGAAAWLALSPEDRARTAIFTSGHALRTEVLDRVRAGLIAEGALGREAIRLRTFENLNLTHEQMRQLSSYTPGQRLDVFKRQSRAGLERGRYEIGRIDPKTGEVELKRGDKIHWLKPESLTTNGKGLALSSPTEIEVRAGDRLIWTTNNRELGIANGSPVDVLRIDRNGITLRDAEATLGFVARLADASRDAHQVAGCGIGQPVAEFAEQGDAVPVGIGLPFVAVAAVVVGGHREVGDVLGSIDLADAADDVKFGDVLHVLSPDRVRRCVLTDMEGPRAARAQAKRRRLHSWKP